MKERMAGKNQRGEYWGSEDGGPLHRQFHFALNCQGDHVAKEINPSLLEHLSVTISSAHPMVPVHTMHPPKSKLWSQPIGGTLCGDIYGMVHCATLVSRHFMIWEIGESALPPYVLSLLNTKPLY